MFKRDKILLLFKSRVKREIGKDLKRIILFGSRARGDNDSSSDFDCLVVLKKRAKSVREKILDIEGDLLYEKNAVFSVFPLSEEELAAKKHEPFIRNALREGRVV